MKIRITYPIVSIKKIKRRKVLDVLFWPFLLVIYSLPIINILTGKPLWSIVVLYALYMAWELFVNIDLVELNRISQFIKLTIHSSILLALIDIFLSPGWAVEVISIVAFSALTISSILFFTDFRRQKQNMLPLIVLIFLTMIGAVLGLILTDYKNYWALIVMGLISVALLLSCIFILKTELITEFKKRMHIK
jgi:hypothetical protein